jgi:hypothetical protein
MLRIILSVIAITTVVPSACIAKERYIRSFSTSMISRTETDLGVPGLSAGDILTAVAGIQDKSGKSIGSAFVRKIVMNDPAGRPLARDVSIQYNLPGGTVLVGGVIENYGVLGPTSKVLLTILGGTGIYKKISGNAEFTPLSDDGKKYLVRLGCCFF